MLVTQFLPSCPFVDPFGGMAFGAGPSEAIRWKVERERLVGSNHGRAKVGGGELCVDVGSRDHVNVCPEALGAQPPTLLLDLGKGGASSYAIRGEACPRAVGPPAHCEPKAAFDLLEEPAILVKTGREKRAS